MPDDDIPGFSDAEVAEQLKPFFAEVDADYAAALGPVVDELAAKPPPTRTSPSGRTPIPPT